MSGQAATIKLSERQLLILQRIERSTTAAARLIQRVRIILLAFGGLLNSGIAAEVGLKKSQVGLWRRRWRESFEALTLIECQESAAELERAVSVVLSDAPRSGAPATFSANEVTLILALACEPPGKSGRPIEQWTYRELADEIMKRKIVSSISISQVWRILSEAHLQPHRSKYWLNTTEKDPRVFERQVGAVCNCYLEAPSLYSQHNTHTVSVDEMTGIQALERNAETIPTQTSQPMRIEYEYTRHGTVCLIGNWHVVTGQMIAPSIVDCRDEVAFCAHIQQTVAVDPGARWVFVVDNLNTHNSESLVRYVAELEKIAPESLGRKGRTGNLKNVATRSAFLSDSTHRVRFVFLPKHSSWLNQIEVIFGIVSRRLLRGASFKSVHDLRERLIAFIKYFNATFARPFRWTYTGKPLGKKQEKKEPRTWRSLWNSTKVAV